MLLAICVAIILFAISIIPAAKLGFSKYPAGPFHKIVLLSSIILQITLIVFGPISKIIYPQDVIVGKNLNGTPQIKELNEVLSNEMILDIGPKTISMIYNIIDKSNTILWNGPAGYFENPNFANGSIEIAKSIIRNNKSNKIYSVAGGGDTVLCFRK